MGCTKHFLMFKWERHDWQRRVTATERPIYTDTSMWGRPTATPHVICHAEYVCQRCGAVKDEGDCTCDAARGDQCQPRLALLSELRQKDAGAPPAARR